jgi:hypothetical protein
MMVFNLATLPSTVAVDAVLSTAAHEFQHMIMHQQDLNEESWLDEGFSMFTEYLLALGDVNWSLRSFVQHPDNQLTLWGVEDNNAADYGASLLFLVYLYERFGLETLQAIYASPLNGLAAVEAVLEAQDAGSVDRLFADWVVTNAMSPDSTSYRYSTLSEKPPVASATIYSLPYSRNQRLQQYATDYYQFGVLPASGELQLRVKMPEDAVLIPLNTLDGVQFWYSGRGDDSNPRLTRAFDLRGVTSAELSYRIWYGLETGWDYGYLSISADGGRTWQIQETPHTTTNNPYQKAYGAGYNGRSAGWEQEQISLDAFAGQEILVRFEVVTDDATHEAGMAIDDVRVDALNYAADFESDDGGWVAEGWVLTDNRLPQRAWLQLAQQVGDEVVLSRWLIEGDTEQTITVNPAAQRTILMISPFAPLTGESTRYTIEVLEN